MKLTALLVLSLALTASAQVVAPYSENFDSGVPAGWTFDPASTEGVGWDVDATPALIGGVTPSTFPPEAPSAGSLNFNDGVDYEDVTDGAVKGYATSPVIDITGLGGTVVIWWSMAYQVEPDAFFWGYDIREIYILDDTSTVVAAFSVGEAGSGADIELDENTWATYFYDASAVLAGSTSCQIQFVFASGDEFSNDYSGWFIDEVKVVCGDSIAPTGVVNLSPPDGSIVISPVPLDWSDSTDTSDCGPGILWGYFVEVDDDPAFGSPNFTTIVSSSAVSVPGLATGTYYWRVTPVDTGLNLGPTSTPTSFIVELPLPPDAPDTLFVNESYQGAQGGEAGFVNPVLDQQPAFSAIFRDPNTVDSAIGLRFQVTDDPTFTTLVFDSGSVGISPNVPKDTRCPNLTINVSLPRDTVYYWRIQFTDASGLTGPFSIPQSFRVGDDFEFGVRNGSSHHGRRCYVATAAFGGLTPEVASLASFRSNLLESVAPGRVFSRWYATAGASAAPAARAASPAARALLAPASTATSSPFAGLGLAALVAALLLAGLRRI